MAARARKPYLGTMTAVGIDATPSLLYNNLSTNGERVAYVHKQRVLLFNEAASESKEETDMETIKELSQVTGAKWVNAGGKSQLVVCMGNGIQVYEARKEHSSTRMHMSFADPICQRMEAADGVAKYCRGVAAVGDRIVVGTFTGEIAVYRDGEVQSPMLSGHKAPITSIYSGLGRYWASADDLGTIVVWSNDLRQVCKFSGNGFPCTSVAVRDDTIIGAFASGHIRLFAVGATAPSVEIGAHARCITALAVHPTLPLMASVGEDTVLNVFNIPVEGETVNVVFTTTITDRLLTGVQFSQRDPENSDVMTCAYDSHSVSVWISK